MIILRTSVIADSTTSVDFVLSDKSSMRTIGTTTAGEMLPRTAPMKSEGTSSILMR